MSEGWAWSKNLAGLPRGSDSSIVGYAGESIAIGRALACGFILFFKAWSDSKYDAVLDAKGELFRIEIKQTGSGKSISTKSGWRSGKNVVKSGPNKPKAKVLDPDQCDFLVGVHTFSGKCWIIPVEVVQIRNRGSLNTNTLSIYEEKWAIFADPPFGFTIEEIRKGFRNYSLADLEQIAENIGIPRGTSRNYRVSNAPRTRPIRLSNRKSWYVLEIWREIFEAIESR